MPLIPDWFSNDRKQAVFMRGRDLKQALQAGKPVFGVAMEGFGQARWPAFFARNATIDFVFLESEHVPNGRESVAWAVQLYAAHGIAPLVRIPGISADRAAMVMDAGAHGVIVPYVETVEQVRAILGAVKYRPLKGHALAQAVEHGIFPNEETRTYLQNNAPDATMVLMIESPTGIANLPEILALGGTDAVLIGPHDLSVSLGIPEQYDHPRFMEATDQIIATCKAANVASGMHVFFTTPEDAIRWFGRGMTFISYRGDTLFVAEGIKHGLGHLRKALGGA
jgi:4-hydroxy-2-oxoheptanedioate aldolase